MLRVAPDEVAVTRNTSEGSNIVVKGVELKSGDEVILTNHNHPSNLDSWKVRARRDGFSVKELAVQVPARSSEELYSKDGMAGGGEVPASALGVLGDLSSRLAQGLLGSPGCDWETEHQG